MDVGSSKEVGEAQERLRGVSRVTPLERSEGFSAYYKAEVFLKREDLQPVRSYKIRGAYNHIAQIEKSVRSKGVVCASAGNHAQGVAFSCRLLDCPAIVFVPENTPRQKRERILALGGEGTTLHMAGSHYDDCAALAGAFAERNGLVLVPPFDDMAVIMGAATIGKEIQEQLGRDPDLVVVPVGGGGLAAGIRKAMPGVRLFGIEPKGAESLGAALRAGKPVRIGEDEGLDTFVDGAAVGKVGRLPFEILQGTIEVAGVDPGDLCTVMLEMYQAEGIIVEPAGALGVAGLAKIPELDGKTVVCVVSGGNNDVSRYAEILERSLVARGLKHYFIVEFPQRPGALRGFLNEVLGPNDDISRFEYVKRSEREEGPALVGIELSKAEDLGALVQRMDESELRCERLGPESPFYRFLI